ncbi:MAG: hypothetical protein WEK74_05980 [Hydrogenophaga sp.]
MSQHALLMDVATTVLAGNLAAPLIRSVPMATNAPETHAGDGVRR